MGRDTTYRAFDAQGRKLEFNLSSEKDHLRKQYRPWVRISNQSAFRFSYGGIVIGTS